MGTQTSVLSPLGRSERGETSIEGPLPSESSSSSGFHHEPATLPRLRASSTTSTLIPRPTQQLSRSVSAPALGEGLPSPSAVGATLAPGLEAFAPGSPSRAGSHPFSSSQDRSGPIGPPGVDPDGCEQRQPSQLEPSMRHPSSPSTPSTSPSLAQTLGHASSMLMPSSSGEVGRSTPPALPTAVPAAALQPLSDEASSRTAPDGLASRPAGLSAGPAATLGSLIGNPPAAAVSTAAVTVGGRKLDFPVPQSERSVLQLWTLLKTGASSPAEVLAEAQKIKATIPGNENDVDKYYTIRDVIRVGILECEPSRPSSTECGSNLTLTSPHCWPSHRHPSLHSRRAQERTLRSAHVLQPRQKS